MVLHSNAHNNYEGKKKQKQRRQVQILEINLNQKYAEEGKKKQTTFLNHLYL